MLRTSSRRKKTFEGSAADNATKRPVQVRAVRSISNRLGRGNGMYVRRQRRGYMYGLIRSRQKHADHATPQLGCILDRHATIAWKESHRKTHQQIRKFVLKHRQVGARVGYRRPYRDGCRMQAGQSVCIGMHWDSRWGFRMHWDTGASIGNATG